MNTVELKKKALHSIHLILRSISSISRLSKNLLRNRDMTNSVYWEVVENEKSEFEAEVCIIEYRIWSCIIW